METALNELLSKTPRLTDTELLNCLDKRGDVETIIKETRVFIAEEVLMANNHLFDNNRKEYQSWIELEETHNKLVSLDRILKLLQNRLLEQYLKRLSNIGSFNKLCC